MNNYNNRSVDPYAFPGSSPQNYPPPPPVLSHSHSANEPHSLNPASQGGYVPVSNPPYYPSYQSSSPLPPGSFPISPYEGVVSGLPPPFPPAQQSDLPQYLAGTHVQASNPGYEPPVTSYEQNRTGAYYPPAGYQQAEEMKIDYANNSQGPRLIQPVYDYSGNTEHNSGISPAEPVGNYGGRENEYGGPSNYTGALENQYHQEEPVRTNTSENQLRNSLRSEEDMYEKADPLQAVNERPNAENLKMKKTKENFVCTTDIDPPVETISDSWIKIKTMENFGRFNQTFLHSIEKLHKEHHIIGWKKSRGDGNCYYRAVISRYFELIHKVYHPSSYIRKFMEILIELNQFMSTLPIYHEYQRTIFDVYEKTLKTYEIKTQEKDPIKAFFTALNLLLDPEFDINLVKVSRLIAFFSLESPKNASTLEEFGVDKAMYESLILTMGEEAEGVILLLLPIKLGVQVIQYNIFNGVVKEEFPNDDRRLKIQIVRRAGHYDILYTIQEMEYEMYNLEKGEYYFHEHILRYD
jgi:hypothetical protein